ncbi:MAG: hypothetical protein CME30_00670 [Gemmatimonadetes bacterium]|nr:hypothetical protein [Gemmatimonadota bacterium]
MSNKDYRKKNQLAVKRLRKSVSAVVQAIEQTQQQLKSAEDHVSKVEQTFVSMERDPGNSTQSLRKFRELEIENRDLIDRIDRGRKILDRLFDQIKFMEEGN